VSVVVIAVVAFLAARDLNAQTVTVAVTIGSNTSTISAAGVEFDSSRGYALGHSFQLHAFDIQVVGKLSIGGREQDVQIKGTTTGLKKFVITKAA
jgi:hypothetical protein